MRFRFVSNTATSEATSMAATDSAMMMSPIGIALKSMATPKIEK